MSDQNPQVDETTPEVELSESLIEPGKVRFFWMNSNFNNFLRGIDDKVRVSTKFGKERPSVAVGLILNGHPYVIPLTSQNDTRWKNQVTVRIKAEEIVSDVPVETVISCLKINNMHPALESELTYIHFEDQSEDYQRLLYKEYDYIKKNLEDITRKATSLHSKITNGKAKHFVPICCDFAKLERNYTQYDPSITYPAICVQR